GGAATYDIAARQFTQQLHAELPPTTVWGYGDGPTGGTYPGPTIEATRDALVTVIWRNDLRDAQGNLRTNHYLDVDLCPHGAEDAAKMVVHLHGGHTPAEFDGYPESTSLPGAFAVYEYPNHQLPAALWYHDHAMGITRLNVYMGLAAFYIIRDAQEIGLGLPSGEFEIPMAIQDRSFNADGSFKYPSAWQGNFFGDTILVNGKVWPFLNVKQGKYRFRILNGCNARTLALSLSNGATFQIIGGDSGLLPAPETLSEIVLAPAERADLILDFATYPAGTEILLTNSAPAPYPGSPGVGVIGQVMKFVVTGTAGHTNAIPTTLRPFEPLAEQDAVQVRDFELSTVPDPCTGSRWAINGLSWVDITEQPVLGTSEIWRFINPTGISHPMHMHLVSFQVLDIQAFAMVNGEVVPIGSPVPPPPHLAGWKDTVEVAPNRIVRVIARFEDYLGRFAYHCHILEHEDHEMMRQFETVECTTDAHCDDGQFCNGFETCSAANTCVPGTPTNCEDLYACTVDYCDPLALGGAGACVHAPDSSLCDNGVFCDGREPCSFLFGCVAGDTPCDPALTCDETLGACTGCTSDTQCDNGDPCTADTCDAGVCTSVPTYDPTTQCCTPGAGTINPIDDGNPCTTDSCDAATGAVAHIPQAGLCAAGLGCRYIRVRPTTPSGTPVAILIAGNAGSGGLCFEKYVQTDGSLGTAPAFQTPGQWGDVDAYGLEIIPQREYTIQLDDGATLSGAVAATTWRFGDADGNDVVNFSDVQQVVLLFLAVTPYSPAGDMKPCVPNGVINFEDIFAAVQGFQGLGYVGGACPDPCP
ncbi:MAG: multicopper oxidase family protein, partial [Phycisphaerae bacterium]